MTQPSRARSRRTAAQDERHEHAEPLTWLDALGDAWFGAFDAAAFPLGALALAQAPKSDGHAVLVLPGFLSGDPPTWLLRWYLTQIGYRAYPWELGLNYGFSTSHSYDIEALIEHRLKEVFLESGDRKISLIGWSLGGVYAKAAARRHPALIRDVITLGSPISGNTANVSVSRLYEWVNKMQFSDPEFARKLRETNRPLEGVPVTAFYCRKDGVVPWRNACEAPGPLVQNIEVKASHVGMGFDALVFYLIAHRLAKSTGKRWRPLDLPALESEFKRQRRPI
jgi:pimeloyl-ACP methyl ester carboxylesterase